MTSDLHTHAAAALKLVGMMSDVPVIGYVMVDKEMREWLLERNMHLITDGHHCHVMQGRKFCTCGNATAMDAIMDVYNSGEYDGVKANEQAT